MNFPDFEWDRHSAKELDGTEFKFVPESLHKHV